MRVDEKSLDFAFSGVQSADSFACLLSNLMNANSSKFSYIFHSLHPWMNSRSLTPRATIFSYYVPRMRIEVCKARGYKNRKPMASG